MAATAAEGGQPAEDIAAATKPRIQRLEEAVVNRIAAGEVIQRPANAIKELLENSLDAGSTSITVTVKDGGLKLLQIQDNGCGIHRDDLDIVCERFTTSKLRAFEDLDNIGTYGFRGEALASVSHVAHLTIVSRTADSACAYRANYSDGKLVPDKPGKPAHPRPHAGTVGTQIIAEDLFYNVPSRRRALKNTAEELNKIADVISRYAVHNAGVGMTLKKAGDPSPVVRTNSSSSTVDNIRAIYGSAIAKELIKVEAVDKELGFSLTGYITNANYNMRRATQLLFINHRSVQSTNIKKALDEVYANYLPKNTHCFAYLSLEISPDKVDVNVHPTKSEVHFMNEDAIVAKIQQAVGEELLGSNSSRTFYTQALLPGASVPTASRHSIASSEDAAGERGDGGAAAGLRTQSTGSAASAAVGSARAPRVASAPASSQRTGRSRTGDEGPRIYDHDLIRTDARAQTLDKFVHRTTAAEAEAAREKMLAENAKRSAQVALGGASAAAAPAAQEDDDDWDPIRMRPKRSKAADKASVDTPSAGAAAADPIRVSSAEISEASAAIASSRAGGAASGSSGGARVSSGGGASSALSTAAASRSIVGRPWPPSIVQLTSILEMRESMQREQHTVFREILKNHVFVGCIDKELALVQHLQHLYILKTRLLSQELFYQLVLRGFGDFNTIDLEPPVDIKSAVLIALEQPEAKWSDEDGPKDDIAAQAASFLVTRAEMLEEYFGIVLNEDGLLKSIPALLEGYMPAFAGLPLFLLRMATDIDWESERECFETMSREIGRFYCEPENDWVDLNVGQAESTGVAEENTESTAGAPADASSSGPGQRGIFWTVEHVVYPALRHMCAPPRRLADQGAALKVADLKDLYKVFERC